MGLDMYLERKTYVQNWDHMKPEHRHNVSVWRGSSPRSDIDPAKISYIVEQVGYWRKANAIHRWFVEHVQGGEDDCNPHYVSREQLKELLDLCNEVLDKCGLSEGKVENGRRMENGELVPILEDGLIISNPEEAEARLPTQSGFFFGGTDYDQYYIDDIKQTVEILKPIVDREEDDANYYYHSSW